MSARHEMSKRLAFFLSSFFFSQQEIMGKNGKISFEQSYSNRKHNYDGNTMCMQKFWLGSFLPDILFECSSSVECKVPVELLSTMLFKTNGTNPVLCCIFIILKGAWQLYGLGPFSFKLNLNFTYLNINSKVDQPKLHIQFFT